MDNLLGTTKGMHKWYQHISTATMLPPSTLCQVTKDFIPTALRLVWIPTEPPKGLKTALEKNDHPELDTSDILEGHQVNHYLTMVGQLQWLITMGRFDIQAQVISMSRFRAAPRQGHLERLKQDLCICYKDKRLCNQV